MNKKILDRILELEELFTIKDYNVEEIIQEIITMLENILNCNVANRIDLEKIDYENEDTIERSIFRFLTIEELRYIAYYNTQGKQ